MNTFSRLPFSVFCISFLIFVALFAANGEAREQVITFTGENDALTRSGDSYYTNGVRASWLDADNVTPEWATAVVRWIPMFNEASATVPLYSVGHSIFTPRDIVPFTNQPTDRPYAGFLYGSIGLTSGDITQVDDVEITAGIVGPSALGEPIQSEYHELIGVQKPNGWENQLNDEPALNLSWQRRWPRQLGINVGDKGLISLMPHVGGALGNVYTYASAGAVVSWMSDEDMRIDTPAKVRPSIAGTGFFDTRKELNWMVFAGVEERLMARNIFLDGNTFQDSPSVEKKNFVTDVLAGVTFTYNRYAIGYTAVYRTKEFYGQPDGQLFGALSFSYKF